MQTNYNEGDRLLAQLVMDPTNLTVQFEAIKYLYHKPQRDIIHLEVEDLPWQTVN